VTAHTRGTAIAALEAERNERQTLADGALRGERRAAVARVAMIAMFAVISQTASTAAGQFRPAQALIGGAYGLFALTTVVVLRRIRVARFELSVTRPMLVTLVDFGFITTMGTLDLHYTGHFDPAMHASASAILIAFAVARIGVWMVVAPVALAVASMVGLAIADGAIAAYPVAFACGGYVVLGFLVALTNRAVRTMFTDLRRRDSLTRFLPQQVAERMLRIGPEALAPVQREVTVLFSDIRGFTTLSEQLEPREVLALLDDYFGRMSQVVKGHDGVLGKFLGDGLLAFWGAPDRVEDHALRAVKAALDMRRVLDELNRERERDGKPSIRIGIGIHTGTVAAGMLGGLVQAEYTVIGDAVNVASRIEGLTKTHVVDLLISETTWVQLDGALPGKKLTSETIRGRNEPVVLYTIGDHES